jgi:hypothetical protein
VWRPCVAVLALDHSMQAISQGGCSSCALTSYLNVSRGDTYSTSLNKTRRTGVQSVSCRLIGSQVYCSAHSSQHVQEASATCTAMFAPSDPLPDHFSYVADRSSVTSQYLAAQNVRRRARAAAILATSLLVRARACMRGSTGSCCRFGRLALVAPPV